MINPIHKVTMKRRIINSLTISVILIMTTLSLKGEPQLSRTSLAQFYPAAGQTFQLKINLKDPGQTGSLKYEIHDYHGKKIKNGTVKINPENILSIGLQLSTGYYEVLLPEMNQAFGIVCLPEHKASPQGFFCIDAGLSWCGWKEEEKKQLVAILTNRGIAAFRERMAWPAIHPSVNQNKFTGSSYSSVRNNVYGNQNGKRILELIQDSPHFLRYLKNNRFSVNLPASYKFWRQMNRSLCDYWHAFEVWNEPFFAKGSGADQYVPVLKTISAALNTESTEQTQIYAGCFSPSIPSDYLNICAANGFLDVTDIVSLHLYGQPKATEDIMFFYRNWLKKNNRPGMPLCISESGSPCMTNKYKHPSATEAEKSAIATTMRGIEAFCCGAKSFYAFYLQSHVEGVINWGMTSGNGSPLRSMGTWLYAAQRLGNKKYAGDLKHHDKEIIRARIFSDTTESVVVIYSPKGKRINLGFNSTRVNGADGRIIDRNSSSFKNIDGLAYVKLSATQRKKYCQAKTRAMTMYEISQQPQKPKKVRQLIIQPLIDITKNAQNRLNGYYLTDSQASNYKLPVIFNNITEKNLKFILKTNLPDTIKPTLLELPPMSSKRVNYKLNLKNSLNPVKPYNIKITAEDSNNPTNILDYAEISFYAVPATKIYSVTRTNTEIIIDGVMSPEEWQDAVKISKFNIISEEAFTKAVKVPPKDLSATAGFLWNDNGLYFAIEVNDNRHVQNNTPALSWKQDSLQIAMYNTNTALEKDHFEWGFMLGKNGPQSVIFSSTGAKKLFSGSKFTVKRDKAKHTTTYEGLISWADMGSMKAIIERENLRFRLSFVINDSDGNGRKWLEWSPGIACSKSVTEFPELILAPSLSKPILKESFNTYRNRLSNKWIFSSPDSYKIVRRGSQNVLEISKSLKEPLILKLPNTKPKSAFSISMKMLITPSSRGFCLKTCLYNRQTREGISIWGADNNMFGTSKGYKTGLSIMDFESQIPIATGKKDAVLPTNKKPFELIIFIDPQTGIIKLSEKKNGKLQMIAEGKSKRNISLFNTLELRLSNWGSSKILIEEIKMTGTAASH